MEKIVAFAGGVGGSKMAEGLAAILPPEELTIVVNTGDDFQHLGLSISPDIDTVTYTLAGLNNKETGWGVAGDTWQMMESLKRLGGEDWFCLGDKDLATHLERTIRLKRGETLSEVTATFAQKLGIGPAIVPMSDEAAPTSIHTVDAVLSFQDYFVRQKSQPSIQKIGYSSASPSPAFLKALETARVVVICPSNPVLSIAPILNLPGIRETLKSRSIPVIVVSPFIGGNALKGPAAKNMAEIGLEPTPQGLAAYYGDLIDGMIIDTADNSYQASLSLPCCVAPTLMKCRSDSAALAETVLNFAAALT